MFYVRLGIVLYKMLRAALLFYKRLRSNLEGMSFKGNPHDPCVANKMMNSKQMTICWHVDDLKVSHVEKLAAVSTSTEAGKIVWTKDHD